MTAKLISCIIPVFNGERYLGEAIDSILAQTYEPLEIIVVDDGSTDGSARVADAFGGAIRRVAQSNQGHAAARNLGLQHARGPLIAFQDADDLWHPQRLERQMNLLQQHPEAGGCVTHVRNFSHDLTQPETETRQGDRRAQGVPGFTLPCLLAHRWAFDRVGVFDVSLGHCDDTDWFLRARAADVEIRVLAEVLCFRRIHEANRSHTNAGDSLDEYLLLLKRHLDKQRSGNG
jgi:glycosyltransferase involved in cell wall biosynthesis